MENNELMQLFICCIFYIIFNFIIYIIQIYMDKKFKKMELNMSII